MGSDPYPFLKKQLDPAKNHGVTSDVATGAASLPYLVQIFRFIADIGGTIFV